MIFERPRVFVSSGMEELAAERLAVEAALEAVDVEPWIFERDAGARPGSPERTFHEELHRSDLYIGIFGARLGRYTREEFERARELRKDCLLYVRGNPRDTHREPQLATFLERVGHVTDGLTIAYFASADDLSARVKADVIRWQADDRLRKRARWARVSSAAPDLAARRALAALAGKVRQFWVDGVLSTAVSGAPLAPPRESRPDALASPWERVLELPDRSRRSIPADQPLDELFRENGGSLLVLGAPGTGKTITLLQLVRRLLDRAEYRPEDPIPVVFNLSSWSESGGPLDEWLVRELTAKYQVPARMSREWIAQYRLIPMLDGLDEVAPSRRAECVTAIDAMAQTTGVPGIVVCCRLDEYMALPTRLAFGAAICLEPLAPEQVLAYANEADPGASGLAAALARERALAELARTPLMLGVMIRAFAGRPLHPGAPATMEEWRHLVFSAYVERMFARAIARVPASSRPRIVRCLEWIATEMHSRALSMFLIEDLQPSAISGRLARAAYVFGSRLAAASIFSMLVGVAITLGFWRVGGAAEPLAAFFTALFPVWPVTGVFFGAGLGVLDFVCLEWRGTRWRPAMPRYVAALVPPLAFLAAALLAISLIDPADQDVLVPTVGVLGGLAVSAIWGRRWLRQSLSRDVASVESLSWSWSAARIAGSAGLAVGFIVGAAMLSTMWPLTGSEAPLVPEILIVTTLSFGLVGALAGGVKPGLIETTTRPNQGMRLSLRNAAACFVGGVVVVTVGVATIFVSGSGIAVVVTGGDLREEVPSWPDLLALLLPIGLAAGLFAGTCAAFWYGGVELLHHAALRLVLRIVHGVPMRLARTLDEARDLVLVRQVGGGYIFLHRLLLEHFARADERIMPRLHGDVVNAGAP